MKKMTILGLGAAVLLLLYVGLHYLPETAWFRLALNWIHQDRAKPQTELGKLITIMDYYRHADVQVVFDDHIYSAEWGWRQARAYLAQNTLSGEDDAAQWIQKHSYRSNKGNIIYFQYPDGSQTPMRDVFLNQLAAINQQNTGESKPL